MLPPGEQPTERHGSVNPYPVRFASWDDAWHCFVEMSDGSFRRLNARDAQMALRHTGRLPVPAPEPYNPVPMMNRVSALVDLVYPDTSLDRELEEAELLSRCYSLPYTVEEIGAAFIAVRRNPRNKVLAIKAMNDHLNAGLRTGLRKAKELVDAVAEKIGAFQNPDTQVKPSDVYKAFTVPPEKPQMNDVMESLSFLPEGVEIVSYPTLSGGQRIGASVEITPKDVLDYEKREGTLADTPHLSLDLAMKKALNAFLRTGTERINTLRGLLKHLFQEDLVTVLAESLHLIDDEHLIQVMQFLGPEELHAVNLFSTSEIKSRIEQESEEPDILEKDISLASDILDRERPGHFENETRLALVLEARYGWTSHYADSVAEEAWKRHFRAD